MSFFFVNYLVSVLIPIIVFSLFFLFCVVGCLVIPGGDHGAMPAEVAGSARGPHLLLPARCARLRQGVCAATQAPPGRQQHGLVRCSLIQKIRKKKKKEKKKIDVPPVVWLTREEEKTHKRGEKNQAG